MSDLAVEWASVAKDITIVSRESGEYWFLASSSCGGILPFTATMSGSGTPGSTAGLLDGAIELGFAGSFANAETRVLSLPRYVLDLIGSYHNARRAPGHFSRAAKRLSELNRPELAAYLETHAREETGHDRLALKDLRALGLPAERIVANLVPDGWQPVYELFDDLAFSEYPLGCVGYCYCFESTAAIKQKTDIETIETLFPADVDASRFARTHSGFGSEAGHVEDQIDLIANLPASDRIEIVKATYATAKALASNVCFDRQLSDASILALIRTAAGEEINLTV